jgi:hypothetical protein
MTNSEQIIPADLKAFQDACGAAARACLDLLVQLDESLGCYPEKREAVARVVAAGGVAGCQVLIDESGARYTVSLVAVLPNGARWESAVAHGGQPAGSH